MPVAFDCHGVKGISRNAIFEKGPFCWVIRFKNVSFLKGHLEAVGRPTECCRVENRSTLGD